MHLTGITVMLAEVDYNTNNKRKVSNNVPTLLVQI